MKSIIAALMLIPSLLSAQVNVGKRVVGGCMGRCDTLKVVFTNETAPYYPPYSNFPLDTLNIFNVPGTTTPRPYLVKVDSGNVEAWITQSHIFATFRIDRNDDPDGRNPFRIWIYPQYNAQYQYIGALVTSPMACPLKGNAPWSGSMWNIRWAASPIPPSNVMSNIIPSFTLAKAAAAQLPISVLKDLAQDAMKTYLQRDTTWKVGKVWYAECFGPLPPS
jgi:hypothetical protein